MEHKVKYTNVSILHASDLDAIFDGFELVDRGVLRQTLLLRDGVEQRAARFTAHLQQRKHWTIKHPTSWQQFSGIK